MTEPSLRLRATRALLAALTASSCLLAACGGSGGSDTASGGTATPAAVSGSKPPAGTSWAFCANEQGMCSFSGTRTIRYGVNGQYEYASHTDGVQCSNTVFGDPAPGKAKYCSIAGTAMAQQPAAEQTASVQLAWIAPQTNADGSPLDDLAGYRVRYGTQSGSYSNTIDIASPHELSHVLKGLPPSTYYFVVTAYNGEKIESVASAEVSKSIE